MVRVNFTVAVRVSVRVVSGIALNNNRCEYGTLNSMFAVPLLRFPKGCKNFRNSAINVILHFFIAHAQSGHISTSAVKSDITMVFLNPDFQKDAKISTICVHLRQLSDYLIFASIFRTLWPKMEVLWRKIGEGVVDNDHLTNSFFPLGVFKSVPIFVKIYQEMQP